MDCAECKWHLGCAYVKNASQWVGTGFIFAKDKSLSHLISYLMLSYWWLYTWTILRALWAFLPEEGCSLSIIPHVHIYQQEICLTFMWGNDELWCSWRIGHQFLESSKLPDVLSPCSPRVVTVAWGTVSGINLTEIKLIFSSLVELCITPHQPHPPLHINITKEIIRTTLTSSQTTLNPFDASAGLSPVTALVNPSDKVEKRFPWKHQALRGSRGKGSTTQLQRCRVIPGCLFVFQPRRRQLRAALPVRLLRA